MAKSTDIYPGTLPPYLEARIKNLWDALSRVETSTVKTTRVVQSKTTTVTEGLSAHESDADAHPQYLKEAVAASTYETSEQATTSFMPLILVSTDLTVPVGRQYLVFKNLEISGSAILTALGDVVIL